MQYKEFITRICYYIEKSIEPNHNAKTYERLVHTAVTGINTVSPRVHEHVESLLRSAQYRAVVNDHDNCQLLVSSAVHLMTGFDEHDYVMR